MDEKKAEINELDRLLDNGITFTVNQQVKKYKFPFSFKNKMIEREFEIHEFTLGVLDRLSLEFIDLEIDENEFNDDFVNTLNVAHKLTGKHCKRLARITAIAALGIDYRDKKQLEKTTGLFFETLTPKKLIQLVQIINTMSNLGDFMNSIRLMSGSRTTKPKRIEDEQLG
jgi:hypothetical protein